MAGILPASDLQSTPEGASSASDSSRLDVRTKLDRGYAAVLYPGAGEIVAVGSLLSEGVDESGSAALERVRLATKSSRSASGPLEATERAERRARGAIRRYAVCNGLTRLLTLTYAAQTADAAQVRRDFAGFARRLRRTFPHLRWVRVLERHESGTLHVHVAISQYVPKSALADLWGHGFVDVRKIRARGGGRREAARTVARYISKYVTKDAVADPGQHRYEVREGFQPVAVRALAWTWHEIELQAIAAGYVSGSPSYVWDSRTNPDWTGPPVIFAAY